VSFVVAAGYVTRRKLVRLTPLGATRREPEPALRAVTPADSWRLAAAVWFGS